jgi:hypothetical protein
LGGGQGRFVVDGLLRPLLPAENSGWRSWWMEGEANAGYPWRVYVHVRCRLGTSSLACGRLVQVDWWVDWSIVEGWPGGRPGGWLSKSSRIEFVHERLALGSVHTYKLLFQQ